MIKRISAGLSALMLALLLTFGSVSVCFAEVTDKYAIEDDAKVFTESELPSLREKLTEGSDKTGWQFILHTDTIGVTSGLYDYYNLHYYDQKSFKSDAILLVFDVASNKGAVITHGDAMKYITDDRMSSLGSMLRGYMDSKDYSGAVSAFTDRIEKYYDEGVPEGGDYSNIHEAQDTNLFTRSLKRFGIFAGIGAVAAGLIFFFVNRSRYKHMGTKNTYDLTANSKVNLSDSEDVFVNQYTTVRRIQRDSDSGSSGGGGGGGSTHGGGDF
jgi:uncharacterized membrane protein YgcG